MTMQNVPPVPSPLALALARAAAAYEALPPEQQLKHPALVQAHAAAKAALEALEVIEDLPEKWSAPMAEAPVLILFETPSEDRVSPLYGPYPFAQITYTSLRVGPDGDDLALFDPEGDVWHLVDDPERKAWTDAVIYSAEKTLPGSGPDEVARLRAALSAIAGPFRDAMWAHGRIAQSAVEGETLVPVGVPYRWLPLSHPDAQAQIQGSVK